MAEAAAAEVVRIGRVATSARREPRLRSEIDVKTLTSHLQGNAFARQLTPLQQQEFARRLRFRRFKPAECVVRQGDRVTDASGFYTVLGCVLHRTAPHCTAPHCL